MDASTHHSPEEIKKHIRTYIIVFVALAVLTVITVGISYLPLSIKAAVAVALLVASIKGSLVAAYFMHLVNEKRLILWLLILTAVFFLTLLIIPVLA